MHKDGYGLFFINYKNYLSSRVAYRVFKGVDPASSHVLHECDNPSCVRPDHLFLGTHQDNMRDRGLKGRTNKPNGTQNGSAKLTDESVRELRKLSSEMTFAALGRQFRISSEHASRIAKGQAWTHLL